MELEFEEDPERPESRMKTSQRLTYEAEARVLRQQVGSLEQIREQLGLSRRKMCQLLLVDPSAWTRWVRDETRVPPHIFKALQWYLLLIEKHPSLHPQFNVGVKGTADLRRKNLDEEKRQLESRLQEQEAALQAKVTELSAALGERTQIGLGWKILLIINSFFMIWLFFKFML
jgi:transcriptional regulator with XRE-family HTH domain